MQDVVIIGGGIAGMSAGIYAARSALNPLILIGPIQGGALTQSHEIENYPGFENAIECMELTGAMEKQARRLGANFEQETVEKISGTEGNYSLHTKSGKEIKTKTIILATGTRPRPLPVPGMKEFFGKGISVCAVCDGFFYRNKTVAIIGGGNTALYEAMYLTKICKKVYIINRSDSLAAEMI
ncbi:MAG: FAD-dependent oxidoreductase, partial [Alphaproteobacteria bacterium]|nr:FAD-dependent oxidoreductase [Alphaproteobacteria bacterium]